MACPTSKEAGFTLTAILGGGYGGLMAGSPPPLPSTTVSFKREVERLIWWAVKSIQWVMTSTF